MDAKRGDWEIRRLSLSRQPMEESHNPDNLLRSGQTLDSGCTGRVDGSRIDANERVIVRE